MQAIRASYALPGVFPAVEIEGMFCVDGALTNPVPTAAARQLGGRLVIGVGLHSDGQMGEEAARGAGRVFGDQSDEDDEHIAKASMVGLGPADRFVTRPAVREPQGRRAGIASTMTGALNFMLDG